MAKCGPKPKKLSQRQLRELWKKEAIPQRLPPNQSSQLQQRTPPSSISVSSRLLPPAKKVGGRRKPIVILNPPLSPSKLKRIKAGQKSVSKLGTEKQHCPGPVDSSLNQTLNLLDEVQKLVKRNGAILSKVRQGDKRHGAPLTMPITPPNSSPDIISKALCESSPCIRESNHSFGDGNTQDVPVVLSCMSPGIEQDDFSRAGSRLHDPFGPVSALAPSTSLLCSLGPSTVPLLSNQESRSFMIPPSSGVTTPPKPAQLLSTPPDSNSKLLSLFHTSEDEKSKKSHRHPSVKSPVMVDDKPFWSATPNDSLDRGTAGVKKIVDGVIMLQDNTAKVTRPIKLLRPTRISFAADATEDNLVTSHPNEQLLFKTPGDEIEKIDQLSYDQKLQSRTTRAMVISITDFNDPVKDITVPLKRVAPVFPAEEAMLTEERIIGTPDCSIPPASTKGPSLSRLGPDTGKLNLRARYESKSESIGSIMARNMKQQEALRMEKWFNSILGDSSASSSEGSNQINSTSSKPDGYKHFKLPCVNNSSAAAADRDAMLLSTCISNAAGTHSSVEGLAPSAVIQPSAQFNASCRANERGLGFDDFRNSNTYSMQQYDTPFASSANFCHLNSPGQVGYTFSTLQLTPVHTRTGIMPPFSTPTSESPIPAGIEFQSPITSRSFFPPSLSIGESIGIEMARRADLLQALNSQRQARDGKPPLDIEAAGDLLIGNAQTESQNEMELLPTRKRMTRRLIAFLNPWRLVQAIFSRK